MPSGIYPRTEAHNRAISLALRGHVVSDRVLKNWTFRGKRHSEESKKEISKTLRERKVNHGKKNGLWKGNLASKSAGRGRARRKFQKANLCQKCGSTRRVERHHKDGNPLNNRKRNIAILCRRCHMIADGRMKKMHEGIARRENGQVLNSQG
jgi:hypothetical protein